MKAVQTVCRHARRPLGRALLLSLAMLLLLGLTFRVVTPFLISTSTVRERMEQAVANWTGHAATIGGVSTIRFWPHPEVTLSDITIHRKDEGQEKVTATIGTLSASFNLFGALIGRPDFEDFHLVDPHAVLIRGAGGRLHWANGGMFVEAISNATKQGNGQALDAAFDAPLGDVRISGGTIDVVSEDDAPVARFERINGTLDWPHLSAGAEIEAEATLNGHRIRVDMSSPQPLLLLDGRSGLFEGVAGTDIGLARFNGLASLTTRGYFSGDAELQASNMPEILRWFGVDPRLVEGLNSFSATARIMAEPDEFRFEDLALGLNDENATGLLELDTPQGGTPKLTGTLAFDHIDFLRLLAALKPAISDTRDTLPSLVSGLDLDLRLSSQLASFGALQMREIALGLLSVNHNFRLDMLEASLPQGSMSGRIATVMENDQPKVGMRLALRGADLAALARQLGIGGPVPAAQGNLDLALTVPQPMDRNAFNAATGTVSLQSGSGRMSGIDIAAIRRQAAQHPYFALGTASGGTLEFDSLKATAVIGGGIADLRDTEIVGRNETVTLAGAVPLANNSLALSAGIAPKDGSPAQSFFIGGAWPNPILWPRETAAPATPSTVPAD